MSKPYRLNGGGRFIDRSKRVTFSFDGKTLTGFQGDTVASAVLASGQRVFGRSFKYHRPRGIFSAGVEEPNALFTLGEGHYGEADIKEAARAFTGYRVRPEGGFRFDAEDWSKSSCDVRIGVASIDLDDAAWNRTLLGERWFDAERYQSTLLG